jgi:hypothetical protein
MSKIAFALAACALLTGSAASAGQRAAERAALINLLKARCMEFGYKPGTRAFAACMQTMAPVGVNCLTNGGNIVTCKRALYPFD